MGLFQILQRNNLKLLESKVFNKDHIFRVEDKNERKMILKTDRINPSQIKLSEIAKSIESELCFKVPEIIKKGDDYIILEDVGDHYLNQYFNNDLPACNALHIDARPNVPVRYGQAGGNKYIEISKNICDDYQRVVNEYLKTENPGDIFENGKKWILESLPEWSMSIIEHGLIEQDYFDKMQMKIKEQIDLKKKNFSDGAIKI